MYIVCIDFKHKLLIEFTICKIVTGSHFGTLNCAHILCGDWRHFKILISSLLHDVKFIRSVILYVVNVYIVYVS